jgi:hypothetical protein
MLFPDGVYVERADGRLRFRWVKASTGAELNHSMQTLARRIGRYLERQVLGSSITDHIAFEPQRGRKVFTLQESSRSQPSMAGQGAIR